MKRLLVILLSSMMVVSSLPSFSLAATKAQATTDIAAIAIVDKAEEANKIIADQPAGSTKEPSQAGLTTVISKVKEKIDIPAEYSDFNFYFNDAGSYSKSYYNLTWSKKDGNAYIQVNCDENYHITYYSNYNYAKTDSGIVTYLKSELLSKAESFLMGVVPDISGKLEYVGADYDGIYNNNYVYSYQRKENGISMPENTVKVSVNSTTGEVTNLSVNWLYDTKVPANNTKLTKEEAAKLIRQNMKMKLVYRSDYMHIYDARGEMQKKAFLVYEPSIPYISIDAKTGAIYLTKSNWANKGAYGYMKEEAAADAGVRTGSSVNELTPEELEKVGELENLISKDKAISLVTGNKALYIDKNLSNYSASLNKLEYGDKSSYVWNIYLNNPKEASNTPSADNYRGYAYATVDAKSSKILSFYASMQGYYDQNSQKWNTVKIKYNKKEARSILEKFLKNQLSSRYQNSILSEEENDYIAYYKNEAPVYGGYRYQYNRVNEGVEYPYNSIYGSVDGVTGKIYSFGSNWDEKVEFESAKGVISADKAMEYYLSKEGYGLKYEINEINQSSNKVGEARGSSVEYEIRLVYRPDITPAYISPFTGEQLNSNGEVYQKASTYSYQDITDSTKYRNVSLLADMNIGFEGGEFLPDQAITVGELNSILNKIGYTAETDQSALSNTSLITREEIAKLFIEKLGLTKMAGLSGIYKTDYLDEASINQKYLGAVALAKGLGLFKEDSSKMFNPKNNVTRFDAVELIMNYITAQKKGIY